LAQIAALPDLTHARERRGDAGAGAGERLPSQAGAEAPRREIAAMDLDNFVLRSKWRTTETYARPEARTRANAGSAIGDVAGGRRFAVGARSQGEEPRRFDRVELAMQLVNRRAEPRSVGLRHRATEIARLLEDRPATSTGRAPMALIASIHAIAVRRPRAGAA